MAQDWYYKLLGEETGPLTFRALRELAADGHLAADDEVRTSTSSWKPASEIPELFQAGDVEEPELATGYDLDMLLTPSSAPVKTSSKRQALEAAKAAANAPPPRWYYKLLGQEMGPATEEEILEQIQNGSLHHDDLIKDGPRGNWIPLEKAALFATAAAAMRPQPEWYCRVLGQELGPMLFDELESMAKSGALNADDEVRHGAEPWARADRTRGLKFSKPVTVAATSHDRSATYVPFGDDAKRKEWYYEILGQEMGPISFQEMLKAVGAGTLAFEDKARKGKAGAWNLVMDVPGLVSTEAKAAYLAAKLEASRPKAAPPAPLAAAAPAAEPAPAPAPTPTRSVIPNVIPTPSVIPNVSASASNTSTSSSYGAGNSGAGNYGGGMGSMSPTKASSPPPPPPPAFKAPKKSSGPAFDFGAMFGSLKEIANPKAIGAVAAILLAGGLIYASQFGFSFGVAGKSEYAEVKQIFTQLESAVNKKDTSAIRSFMEQNKDKVEKLKKQIESQSPGSDRRLLQLMLFATRDHIPAIGAGDATADARFKTLKAEMAEAARLAGDS